METLNTNAAGANNWLDGVTSGLNSITDKFAQLYLARAQYETIKNANRNGFAYNDQASMLGSVPRDQQVTALTQQQQAAAAQQGQWLKWVLLGLAGVVAYKLVR